MEIWEHVKNAYFIIDEMHNIPYDDAMVEYEDDYYFDSKYMQHQSPRFSLFPPRLLKYFRFFVF